MKITGLVLLDFGKFHQREIKLGSGLNLITGANESGKTTLSRFLRSMLYGLERERGLRARKDDYTKYRPWEYGRYQGILTFEAGGETYRLFRNFLTTEKQVTLTKLSTGEEIALPEEFLREQGLVSESVFANTFFVGNVCGTGEELAGDMKNVLANLAGGADSGMDLERSLAWLEARAKEKKKELPEKELGECMELLMQKDEVSARMSAVRQELEGLTNSETIFREEQKRLQMELDRLVSRQRETKDQENRYLMEEKEVLRRQSEEGRQRAAWKKSGLRLLGVCSVCAAVSALAGMLCLMFGRVSPGVATLCFVGSALFVLSGMLFGGRRLHRSSESKNGQNTWEATVQELKRRLAEAGKAYQLLTEEFASLQRLLMENYEKQKELLPLIEQKKHAEEQLEEQLLCIEAAGQRYEELLKLREEKQKELAAINLAAESLRRIAKELYEEYGEKFAKALAAYAKAFTDGAYEHVTASEELVLRAVTEERTLELSDVSFGTGEQFSLALRFAAMDVFDPEKKLPVILDDSLASFDTQRMESAMLTLAGCGRQVLLLSCTGREETCAKGLGIPYETVV